MESMANSENAAGAEAGPSLSEGVAGLSLDSPAQALATKEHPKAQQIRRQVSESSCS